MGRPGGRPSLEMNKPPPREFLSSFLFGLPRNNGRLGDSAVPDLALNERLSRTGTRHGRGRSPSCPHRESRLGDPALPVSLHFSISPPLLPHMNRGYQQLRIRRGHFPEEEEDLKTEMQSRITGSVLRLSPRAQRDPIGAGRW
jgi:hypothetical protein